MYPNLNQKDEYAIRQFARIYHNDVKDNYIFQSEHIQRPSGILNEIVELKHSQIGKPIYNKILSKMSNTDAKILYNNVIIKEMSEPDHHILGAIFNNDPQVMDVLSNIKSMRPDIYSGLMQKYNVYKYYKIHGNPPHDDHIDIKRLLEKDWHRQTPREPVYLIKDDPKKSKLVETSQTKYIRAKKKTASKPKRKPIKKTIKRCSCKKK